MTPLAAVGLVFVWLFVLMVALGAVAAFERRARLLATAGRAKATLRKRDWGGSLDFPPAEFAPARSLAFLARLVRGGVRVEAGSDSLRRASRMLSLAALMSGLSLLPLVSGWYAADPVSSSDPPALVLFDSHHGLAMIVFLILVSGLAHTATGLSERNEWARLAAVRVAGCALAGTALLLLVLAPVALATGSLRLSEIALAQSGSFAPMAGLGELLPESFGSFIDVVRLPNWFLFRQPLTTVLAVPTLLLLLNRSLLLDGRGQSSGPSGYGLDADPSFLYGAKLEARVAETLAAALFVAIFLGASGLPFVDARALLAPAHAALGSTLPAVFFFIFESSVFVGKLLLVLFSIQFIRRISGSLRIDQSFGIVTRRLLPLAWANLLLLGGFVLWQVQVRGATEVIR